MTDLKKLKAACDAFRDVLDAAYTAYLTAPDAARYYAVIDAALYDALDAALAAQDKGQTDD